ncbi:MAG: hypothetical protein Q4C71_02910 [Microbacteriaceae bacterium]|nr:hypothetical protein [Microbacteriaceae bacterium]
MSHKLATKMMAGIGAVALIFGLAACSDATARAENTTCKEYMDLNEDQQTTVIKDLDAEKTKNADTEELNNKARTMKAVCASGKHHDKKLKDISEADIKTAMAQKAENTTCKQYSQMSQDQQKQLIKDLDNGKSKPEDITDQTLKFATSLLKTACDAQSDKNIKLKDIGKR